MYVNLLEYPTSMQCNRCDVTTLTFTVRLFRYGLILFFLNVRPGTLLPVAK